MSLQLADSCSQASITSSSATDRVNAADVEQCLLALLTKADRNVHLLLNAAADSAAHEAAWPFELTLFAEEFSYAGLA